MLRFFNQNLRTGPLGQDEEYAKHCHEVRNNPEFGPFRVIFQRCPSLLDFVYAEKARYPLIPCDKREVTTQPAIETSSISDQDEKDQCLFVDAYHPLAWHPFLLKGIWLPIKDLNVYSVLADQTSCPLLKKNDQGESQVLFLIHPKSEAIYAPLIAQYADRVEYYSALSLSSFRSVLVALPDGHGSYEAAMVKLSLDAHLRGAHRLLSERACKIAVANTAILNGKLSLDEYSDILQYMEEPFAVNIKGFENAGMIYRAVPQMFNPKQYCNSSGLYFVPLLSLIGVKNLPFFQTLVRSSHLNVSEFLIQNLLDPVATLLMKLFVEKEISFEIHAQNLGLQINKNNQVRGLIYRDMEGVNLFCSEQERTTYLPENLRDPAIFYFDQHDADSASSIEGHFIYGVLGPLTRQLVKCPDFFDNDPALCAWRKAANDGGYLENWTLADLTNDEYDPKPAYKKFIRYGYVEYLFFNCIIKKLECSAAVSPEIITDLQAHYSQWEENENGDLFPPCTYHPFFNTMVLRLLTEVRSRLSEKINVVVANDNAICSYGSTSAYN